MPSKSKKQVAKMAVLHEQGKITNDQWSDFKPTKAEYAKLPTRVRPKRKGK